MESFLNKALILRLAKYFRVLQRLKSLGFINVFSNNLGDAIGVSPTIVRKDFSIINLPGNKRGGYNIDTVLERLAEVLGKTRPQEVILAGCGKIGTALMESREFAKESIKILAGFDIDPARINPQGKIPVYELGMLQGFVKEHGVRVGVIAVSDGAAAGVLDLMVEAGIQGVLNFSPVELKGNGRCVIHTVNIGLELENLFYLVNQSVTGIAGRTIQDEIE